MRIEIYEYENPMKPIVEILGEEVHRNIVRGINSLVVTSDGTILAFVRNVNELQIYPSRDAGFVE
jgi:hypothetical protein